MAMLRTRNRQGIHDTHAHTQRVQALPSRRSTASGRIRARDAPAIHSLLHGVRAVHGLEVRVGIAVEAVV